MKNFTALSKQSNVTVKGSLAQVAKDTGKSIAATFVDADCIILIDVSGSMQETDAPGGKSRYEAACGELEKLQGDLPGKVAIISFNHLTTFNPNGIPTSAGGGTNLTSALEFAKVCDFDGVRFVVVSDGEPDDPYTALAVAKTYRNKIDVIFCGNEARPDGREFLRKLAKASGGQEVTADRVAQLSNTIHKLLAA